MMAIVVLVCGIVAVTESYRSILRTRRQSVEMSRAARLLEGQMLEMEKTNRPEAQSGTDSELGTLAWKDLTAPTSSASWTEHHLTLDWGEKGGHALELSAWLAN
jgi:hypothetical protein